MHSRHHRVELFPQTLLACRQEARSLQLPETVAVSAISHLQQDRLLFSIRLAMNISIGCKCRGTQTVPSTTMLVNL